MLRNLSRSIVVGWMALLALSVAIGVAMGANLSTTALLVALGVSPAVVALLIAAGAPSPSVVEILHSFDTKDGRS